MAQGGPSGPAGPGQHEEGNAVEPEPQMFEIPEEGLTFMAHPSEGGRRQPQERRPRNTSATFCSLVTPALLHQCTADEAGQTAESEQQKMCLSTASSAAALMTSRRSTSVAFDPPACGYAAVSSAPPGQLHPQLLH